MFNQIKKGNTVFLVLLISGLFVFSHVSLAEDSDTETETSDGRATDYGDLDPDDGSHTIRVRDFNTIS